LYKNQWQLATESALYSDGERYAPFRLAFEKIGESEITPLKKVLVLGAGLGSVIQILSKKYQCNAQYSLVEIDKQILSWSEVLLGQMQIQDIKGYNEDAYAFLINDKSQYDLICIDIFIDREVPQKFLTPKFFNHIKSHLSPNGFWIMNYMFKQADKLAELQNNIATQFKNPLSIQKRENIIFYGKNDLGIKKTN